MAQGRRSAAALTPALLPSDGKGDDYIGGVNRGGAGAQSMHGNQPQRTQGTQRVSRGRGGEGAGMPRSSGDSRMRGGRAGGGRQTAEGKRQKGRGRGQSRMANGKWQKLPADGRGDDHIGGGAQGGGLPALRSGGPGRGPAFASLRRGRRVWGTVSGFLGVEGERGWGVSSANYAKRGEGRTAFRASGRCYAGGGSGDEAIPAPSPTPFGLPVTVAGLEIGNWVADALRPSGHC